MLRLNITMLIKVDCSLYCHYLAWSLRLVTFAQGVSVYMHVCVANVCHCACVHSCILFICSDILGLWFWIQSWYNELSQFCFTITNLLHCFPVTYPPRFMHLSALAIVRKLAGTVHCACADTTDWTFCKTCNRKRPKRAHHCRRCHQCVMRMDHHCPW